jgi:hypothetical protein
MSTSHSIASQVATRHSMPLSHYRNQVLHALMNDVSGLHNTHRNKADAALSDFIEAEHVIDREGWNVHYQRVDVNLFAGALPHNRRFLSTSR